jgi:hypothetical protein
MFSVNSNKDINNCAPCEMLGGSAHNSSGLNFRSCAGRTAARCGGRSIQTAVSCVLTAGSGSWHSRHSLLPYHHKYLPNPLPRNHDQSRRLLAASPLLVVVPSILCGSLWFLYTFLGVFKSEGIGGIDCITPLIVGGLPVLFWVFKKPIDKLLLPLKPGIQTVPRPMRLGIALAVPFVLGCGCSTLSSSGYLALNVSAFVSVMTAVVLLSF